MDNLKGMGWMTLAMLTFAIADMFIVLASETLPVGQIVVMFGLVGAPLLGAYAISRGVKLWSPVIWSRPLLVRNFCEIWATVAVIVALSILPFAFLSAVLQAVPLLVTLGATLFLGERVGWRRWTAIAIGLLGVLIILRPTDGAFSLVALWAVVAVTGMSARDLATRLVPSNVHSLQISTYGFASTIPAGIILMAFQDGIVTPSAINWVYTSTAAVFGAVAYFAITMAMRTGDISVVTPFRYTRLIFAFAIAMVVFGERPDALTWIGAAIVIATGIYTLAREGRAKRSSAA